MIFHEMIADDDHHLAAALEQAELTLRDKANMVEEDEDEDVDVDCDDDGGVCEYANNFRKHN